MVSGKQIGFAIAGLVVIGLGYYIGFVGWTDTQMTTGPQGYGLYEVTTTYPIAGIVAMIAGLGLIGNAFGGDDDEGTEEIAQPTDTAPADETGQSTMTSEGAMVETDRRHCTSCGAEIAANAAFCTECGESIEAGGTAAGG